MNYFAAPGLPKRYYGPRELQRAVEKSMGLPEGEIRDKSRKRKIVWARHIFFHLAERYAGWMSLQKVGDYCGGFDHATVLHGRKNARNLMQVDPEFRGLVNQAEKLLTT